MQCAFIIFTLTQLSPNLSLLLYSPNFVVYVYFCPIKSNLWCPFFLGYVIFQESMVDVPGDTHNKENRMSLSQNLSGINSFHVKRLGEFHSQYSLCAGICPYTGVFMLSQLLLVNIGNCLAVSRSQCFVQFLTASRMYNLSAPLFTMIPEPWESGM